MIELLVVIAVFAAVALGIRLDFRIYGSRPLITLLLLFAATGIPDVVITTHYAYLNPEMEGNPLTALFLSFEFGIVLGAFLWAFLWIALAELFLRINLRPLAYFTLLSLFAGHLLGLLTWAGTIETGSIRYLSWVLGFAYTILIWAALELWKKAKE
ncbi:hypothetical protein GF412_05270 [Candidatus Micrarchaeota archaeon]|nr:hypothetical protein [Candidatus Micrarchaeota archaeon]MBD3418364.1 hypothetical protein [Candidatus Micrarchaeota archaeon]